MARKLKHKPQRFTKQTRIGPDHIPPEAGAKGASVARVSAGVLENLMQSCPFELAVCALVIIWRNDEGKLMCIPSVAGADTTAIPAVAAALRSIADNLDAGDYSTVYPEPPPGTVAGKA